MLKIQNNPFDDLLDVIEKLYPDLNIPIYFDMFAEEKQDETIEPCWGCTEFDEQNKPTAIYINIEIPVFASIEIIAHEVAHCIAGIDEEHGAKWEEEFNKIYKAYEEYMGSKVKEGYELKAVEKKG